jgi:L-serine/L-threonine ammonia-lyase
MNSRAIHVATPLIESLPLSRHARTRIWLKLEALQPCGSFKARGIGFACRRYLEAGYRRFVSSSGGNAGLALAYAGRRLEVPVTVVVPVSTPELARQLMRDEAAEVVVLGQSWQEAHEHALTLLDAHAAYVHPFDDPFVWEGHASLIDEVFDAGLEPDAVVLSVGGGGLLCGVALGLQRAGKSHVKLVTAETLGAESFYKAVQADALVELECISSVATTLGAKKVARRALEVSHELEVVPCVVSDREAIDACLRFADDHRLIVEPACGAALAVVYNAVEALRDATDVLLIVCGGAGVTYARLLELERNARIAAKL